MEGELIQISKINDFIFCPHSIYFHGVYESFDQKVYHDEPQTEGKILHERIESGEYSTEKKILQGVTVVNQEWGVIGKIDIFDIEKGELVERKAKLKKIFDGHQFQLYCQMLCLREMGAVVKKMTIRSIKDNKNFDVSLPSPEELHRLKGVLEKMKNFKVEDSVKNRNPNKCARCIYAQLCV